MACAAPGMTASRPAGSSRATSLAHSWETIRSRVPRSTRRGVPEPRQLVLDPVLQHVPEGPDKAPDPADHVVRQGDPAQRGTLVLPGDGIAPELLRRGPGRPAPAWVLAASVPRPAPGGATPVPPGSRSPSSCRATPRAPARPPPSSRPAHRPVAGSSARGAACRSTRSRAGRAHTPGSRRRGGVRSGPCSSWKHPAHGPAPPEEARAPRARPRPRHAGQPSQHPTDREGDHGDDPAFRQRLQPQPPPRRQGPAALNRPDSEAD